MESKQTGSTSSDFLCCFPSFNSCFLSPLFSSILDQNFFDSWLEFLVSFSLSWICTKSFSILSFSSASILLWTSRFDWISQFFKTCLITISTQSASTSTATLAHSQFQLWEISSSPYFPPNNDNPDMFLVCQPLNEENYNTWSRSILVSLVQLENITRFWY